MKTIKPKPNDIYRWRWNDETLKKLVGKHGSTIYWCCSQICIYQDDKFYDTYWDDWDDLDDGDDYKSFTTEEAKEQLILKYIGNFDDLVKVRPNNRAYYADEDCIDISHPNMVGTGFYIKKGTRKSLTKMKTVMQREINKLQDDLSYIKHQIKKKESKLKTLSTQSYFTVSDDVDLHDVSYQDES